MKLSQRAPIQQDPNAKVRFVPLGGLEEIGRNMAFVEYKDEIICIDAGLQFAEDDTPGIDFIIPNTAYLEAHKKNVRALIITHGHLDHIGALPYIIEKIGNPPIYTTLLAKHMILKRQEDFPNSPKLSIITINDGDKIRISEFFEAEFFDVSHTIPDSSGVLLKTPVGNIMHMGDFRVEYDENGDAPQLENYRKIASQGVHTFLCESTGSDRVGTAPSEATIEKNLEDIFRKAQGRIILATFSSLLTRVASAIRIAEKLGRRVALSGFSMKTNVQIAQELGYIKAPDGLIIPLEEIGKIRDDKLVIVSTGAQGESNASLMKIINGEHRHIQVKTGDTVIFSSSVIPGNERSVQYLQDNLSRQGAIVYNSSLVDIHSSGHAFKEDIIRVIKAVNPRFVIPVHGYYFKRTLNCHNAYEAGVPLQNTLVMDNGEIAELGVNSLTLTKETVPAYYVMVDGLGVGDVEEVVLRDRLSLAQEGMLVIIMTMDRTRAKLLKNPDIISRGFIYLKDNHEMLEEIRKKIKGLVTRTSGSTPDSDYIKTLIRDQIGQFIYNKTHRRPMLIPVIIEI